MIFGLMSPVLTDVIRTSVDLMYLQIDERNARNKMYCALSLLESPVFYCGMGMPQDAFLYRKSFGNSTYEPFRWDGPVSVVNNGFSGESAELRIAYAIPSYQKVSSALLYKSSDRTIKLDAQIPDTDVTQQPSGIPVSIKNFVIFSSSFPSSFPFAIREIDGTRRNITVESLVFPDFLEISKGDSLSYLGAMRVYCKGNILYTNDFRTAGDQPRVAQINDIRFIVDKEKGIISIFIMAQGTHKFSSYKDIEGQETWPQHLIAPHKAKKSYYKRYAMGVTWRLSNLTFGKYTSKITKEWF